MHILQSKDRIILAMVELCTPLYRKYSGLNEDLKLFLKVVLGLIGSAIAFGLLIEVLLYLFENRWVSLLLFRIMFVVFIFTSGNLFVKGIISKKAWPLIVSIILMAMSGNIRTVAFAGVWSHIIALSSFFAGGTFQCKIIKKRSSL